MEFTIKLEVGKSGIRLGSDWPKHVTSSNFTGEEISSVASPGLVISRASFDTEAFCASYFLQQPGAYR